MFKQLDLITKSWSDYELVDSGEGRKLERWGNVIIDRPETQALWLKKDGKRWKEAMANFEFVDGKGKWRLKKDCPKEWTIALDDMRFNLQASGFKHVGLFPEHRVQWEWIQEKINELKGEARLLNLFGYTGAASVAAAKAGAFVTHVDSSKQSVSAAAENAKLSGLQKDAIRWIVDDAVAFVKKEARRGNQYEGILLDPPAFGRGAKGQVWHLEKDLLPLLQDLKKILADTPGSFILLSGYAAGYAPQAFAQMVESVFADEKMEGTFGALHLEESSDTNPRLIPTGIYVRLTRLDS